MTEKLKHAYGHAEVLRKDIRETLDTKLDFGYLANNTIMITGAAGFIPAYLIELLLGLNHKLNLNLKIIGIVRNKPAATERFRSNIHDDALQIIQHDMANMVMPNIRANIIIHAASQASPKYYSSDPLGTALPNILGTLSVLEIAKTNQSSQLLYVSTSEVYGKFSDANTVLREDNFGSLNPMDIRSCYAESKRMGENLCISAMHQHGVPVKVARIFHTYGPGMKLDDARVFADFTRDILTDGVIKINGTGEAERAFCYLTDTARALLYIITKGEAGQAYNVANPDQNISISGLAELLVRTFPERLLRIAYNKPEDKTYIPSAILTVKPDISKLIALGWKPIIDLSTGFRRTIRSYE
jgi:UDP-glucuronate decarboxylase